VPNDETRLVETVNQGFAPAGRPNLPNMPGARQLEGEFSLGTENLDDLSQVVMEPGADDNRQVTHSAVEFLHGVLAVWLFAGAASNQIPLSPRARQPHESTGIS
jgi:hypothetical protein